MGKRNKKAKRAKVRLKLAGRRETEGFLFPATLRTRIRALVAGRRGSAVTSQQLASAYCNAHGRRIEQEPELQGLFLDAWGVCEGSGLFIPRPLKYWELKPADDEAVMEVKSMEACTSECAQDPKHPEATQPVVLPSADGSPQHHPSGQGRLSRGAAKTSRALIDYICKYIDDGEAEELGVLSSTVDADLFAFSQERLEALCGKLPFLAHSRVKREWSESRQPAKPRALIDYIRSQIGDQEAEGLGLASISVDADVFDLSQEEVEGLCGKLPLLAGERVWRAWNEKCQSELQ